jgi:hypothetical protein
MWQFSPFQIFRQTKCKHITVFFLWSSLLWFCFLKRGRKICSCIVNLCSFCGKLFSNTELPVFSHKTDVLGCALKQWLQWENVPPISMCGRYAVSIFCYLCREVSNYFWTDSFHSRTIDLHTAPSSDHLRVLEGEMSTNYILHQSESFTPIVQEHLPPIICGVRMVFHDPIKHRGDYMGSFLY